MRCRAHVLTLFTLDSRQGEGTPLEVQGGVYESAKKVGTFRLLIELLDGSYLQVKNLLEVVPTSRPLMKTSPALVDIGVIASEI